MSRRRLGLGAKKLMMQLIEISAANLPTAVQVEFNQYTAKNRNNCACIFSEKGASFFLLPFLSVKNLSPYDHPLGIYLYNISCEILCLDCE